MKKLMVLLSAFLMVFAVVSSASALTNGDFEEGNLNGWDSMGSAAAVDFNDGSHPSGPIADFIASVQGMDNYFALLGAHTTSGVSGISQDFDVSVPGQVEVSFDWAFDFIDINWREGKDDVFIAFGGPTGGWVNTLTLEEVISTEPLGAVWGHYSMMFDLPFGNWSGSINFQLDENSSWFTNSLAGVDNVHVGAPVPEPATMMLLGTGLLGLAVIGRKKFFK